MRWLSWRELRRVLVHPIAFAWVSAGSFAMYILFLYVFAFCAYTILWLIRSRVVPGWSGGLSYGAHFSPADPDAA